jgi:hypothetical protein
VLPTALALPTPPAPPTHDAQPIYLRNKVALTTNERMKAKAEASA